MYKSLPFSKLVQVCTNLSLSEIKIVVPALLHFQSCYPVVGVSVEGYCRGGGLLFKGHFWGGRKRRHINQIICLNSYHVYFTCKMKRS